MDKQSFLDKLKAVGTSEDETERRSILAELTDEVSKIYDENTSLSESNKSYIDDNEKLRSANMQLFLQVGANKTDEQIKENITGVKDDPTPEPRKFENLFNNEGGLK